MIQAVIFDFDGVLNNFPEVIWRERRKLLETEYKVRLTPEDLEHLLGLTLDDQVAYIGKKYPIKLTKEELIKHRESVKHILETEAKLMPGVQSLLRELKRAKIKRVIASNKTRILLEEDLEKLKIRDSFDLILAREDANKPKPNPEIFLKAAKRLNVPRNECVVIEDALHGIKGAKKAGMYAVGVCSPFHSSFKHADLTVRSMKELTLKKIRSLAKK